MDQYKPWQASGIDRGHFRAGDTVPDFHTSSIIAVGKILDDPDSTLPDGIIKLLKDITKKNKDPKKSAKQ